MSDISVGRALRDSQLALFELGYSAFLELCRDEAAKIATQRGQVSINDVREVVELPWNVSPNVFGAVFKDRRFVPVGFAQASHPGAHARVIRVYKLKGE